MQRQIRLFLDAQLAATLMAVALYAWAAQTHFMGM
jgi:hypothetical protein